MDARFCEECPGNRSVRNDRVSKLESFVPGTPAIVAIKCPFIMNFDAMVFMGIIFAPKLLAIQVTLCAEGESVVNKLILEFKPFQWYHIEPKITHFLSNSLFNSSTNLMYCLIADRAWVKSSCNARSSRATLRSAWRVNLIH